MNNLLTTIRTEIERYINHYEKIDRNDFTNGEYYICRELLSFLDTLEQKPADLEKEIDKYFDGWYDHETGVGLNANGEALNVGEIIEIARHFFELGKNTK